MTDAENQIPHPFAQLAAPAAQDTPPAEPSVEAVPDAPENPVAQNEAEAAAAEPTQQTPEQVDWEARARELEATRERERLEREQERTQTEQQMAQWTQFRQQQAQQQREQQLAKVREQYEQDLSQTYNRLVDVDDEKEGRKALGEFVNKYMGQAQQAFQQREQQLEQTYQQRLSQAEVEVREYLAQQMKPGAAKQLVEQYQLPASAEKILLDLPDPNQMPQWAALMQQQLSQVAPQATQQAAQQVAQRQAEAHRANGTFNVGGVSGGPLPSKEFSPMTTDSAEAAELTRAIFGM